MSDMKICKACNAENEDGSVFCVECGSKFEADAPAESTVSSPEESVTQVFPVTQIPAEEAPVPEAPAEAPVPAEPVAETPAPVAPAAAPAAPVTPVSYVPVSGETIAPPRARKKKLLPAIIAAAVVVVLAVVGALAATGRRDVAQLFRGKNYAKNYVVSNLKNDFEDAKTSIKASQEIYSKDTLSEELSIKLTDNKKLFDKLYDLAGLSDSDIPNFAGASIVLTAALKSDYSSMAANLALSILPGKTVNGVLAFDDENIIFGIPELLDDEIFSFPRIDEYGDDILAALDDIDLSAASNTDFLISAIDDVETETIAFFESLEYKVENNYAVSVNGKTVKLDRITTYISAKQLTEYARSVLARLRKNKELANWYNDYAESLGYDDADYREVIDELIDRIDDELDLLDEEDGGINLGFLVNKGNENAGATAEAIDTDVTAAEVTVAAVPGKGYEVTVKAPDEDVSISVYGDYDKSGSGYKGTITLAADVGALVTVDLGTYSYDKSGYEFIIDLGNILGIKQLADAGSQITDALDDLGLDAEDLKLRFTSNTKDLSTEIALESGGDALITIAASIANSKLKIPKTTSDFDDIGELGEYIAEYITDNEEDLRDNLEEYLGITEELYELISSLFTGGGEPPIIEDDDPPIEYPFGLGTWDADRTIFFNSWSNLMFFVPDGFSVASDEDIIGVLGGLYDDYLYSGLTYNDYVLSLNPDVYWDAYLVSDGGEDVQIQYEDLSEYELEGITLEEFADMIASNYGDMQLIGTEEVKLGIDEDSYLHASYYLNSTEGDVYFDFYVRRQGDYLIYLTLAGYTADNATRAFLDALI
jgi:hypothetical protein